LLNGVLNFEKLNYMAKRLMTFWRGNSFILRARFPTRGKLVLIFLLRLDVACLTVSALNINPRVLLDRTKSRIFAGFIWAYANSFLWQRFVTCLPQG